MAAMLTRTLCLLVLYLKASADPRPECEYVRITEVEGGRTMFTCNSASIGYIRGFIKFGRDLTIVCCPTASQYYEEKYLVHNANWSLGSSQESKWGPCPQGFFLSSFERSEGHDNLGSVETGRCLKPVSPPYSYAHCYIDNNPTLDSDDVWVCNPDYSVTALYLGTCDKDDCFEKMKCCKVASKPDPVDSLASAKIKVIDKTLPYFASLAFYLGFNLDSPDGADFHRHGDMWSAKSLSNDARKPEFVSWSYGSWKFVLKNITYGESQTQDLPPEVVATGNVKNDLDDVVSHEVMHSIDVVRTVTHSATSPWRRERELSGVTLVYNPVSYSDGVSGATGYNFRYSTSATTLDSAGNEQSQTLSLKECVSVKANSDARWSVHLFKTRKTVPYTATILIHFSAEISGPLKGGAQANNTRPNLHWQYSHSQESATVNYQFGEEDIPFYEALKRESDSLQYPWLWNQLKMRFNSSEQLIDSLVNEKLYEFTLNGMFDDVTGKNVSVQWS